MARGTICWMHSAPRSFGLRKMGGDPSRSRPPALLWINTSRPGLAWLAVLLPVRQRLRVRPPRCALPWPRPRARRRLDLPPTGRILTVTTPLRLSIMGGLVPVLGLLAPAMGGSIIVLVTVMGGLITATNSRFMGGPPALPVSFRFPHTLLIISITSTFPPLLREFRMLLHQWRLHLLSLLRCFGLCSIRTRCLRRRLRSRGL